MDHLLPDKNIDRPGKRAIFAVLDGQTLTPSLFFMFSKLLHLYSVVDQAVTQIRNQFPAEVKCGPGCADCCHALFDVSAIEAAYLASLLSSEQVEELNGAAQQAAAQFNKALANHTNPAEARIRCPLLGAEDTCLCYQGRPINCRTYGTPTVIEGQAHVCGLSAFDKGLSYPTINLAPLQQGLYQYSTELFGPEISKQRFSLALVILEPEKFPR
ncbi:MAG: YkgJ family cysteine cluster protein [Proteobacteria bacterium]|nr:YkgJ family cysteine cluster protein [Pseudomonadota bacterium]MBU1639664.1 YkgJ family cysteine cluster protein [Pseudomonadota bacterium]